ncbi:MAG: sensor histidine kinase [Minisyncoccota bacterium]
MHFNPADVQTTGIGLAAFLITLITVFVFLSARKEKLGRALLILLVSGTSWAWFGFLYGIVPNLALARDMRAISVMAAVWIVMLYVNFSTIYLEERVPVGRWGKSIRLFWTIGGALLSLILIGDLFGGRLIIGGLVESPNRVLAPSAGPLMIVLIAFHALCLAISAVLFARRARASIDESDRRQVEIIGFSWTIALIFGDSRLITFYGFDHPLLVFMAAIAVPIFVFATFYSIKRYKLLNIQVVVTQILIFALWAFTFFRILLDKTLAAAIPDIGLFVAVLVLGIYLLRSIIMELRSQKELAQLTIERVKSEFVTVAAHQLRTPLTAIRWAFNSLSPKDAAASLSEEQRRMIDLGKGAADNMTLIVNDLLNVARISGGVFQFSIEPGDVREAVRAATNLFEETAKNKNIRLVVDLPPAPLPAKFDRGNFALAIENLIDNAIKYTPSGGSVSVDAARDGDKVLVSVVDTGIGISREEQMQLFQKFFRGKSAAHMSTDGSGLGLFIAKNIIKGHDGTIALVAREGGGTEATIALPVSEAPH